ncbi:MAG TPA: PIN domain-containing protein [Nitrososphaera sp.]|nr:PIN domain-containing protein [Nitrososphaera sp.]
MVYFDTDILITYLQKDMDAIKELEDLKTQDDPEVVTTAVNAAEQWCGVYRSKEGQKEAAKVKRLLDLLELIPLDRESARMVGELDAAI